MQRLPDQRHPPMRQMAVGLEPGEVHSTGSDATISEPPSPCHGVISRGHSFVPQGRDQAPAKIVDRQARVTSIGQGEADGRLGIERVGEAGREGDGCGGVAVFKVVGDAGRLMMHRQDPQPMVVVRHEYEVCRKS